jgi:DNA-binding PadR family transcriptional regulator
MRHVSKQPIVTEPKSLTEPVFLILMSLADQPRHGYALIKDIERLSNGRVRLSTGTLFGAIRRLLESGWIERAKQHDRSRGKQDYKLTSEGLSQLKSELNRMRQLTRAANARLKIREAI